MDSKTTTMKSTSFRLDEDSSRYLKILAKHYGISEAGLFRFLLRLKMREEGLDKDHALEDKSNEFVK